ncbi:MAG: hypothetical protein WD597_14785 [Balneolaceae bacterium]
MLALSSIACLAQEVLPEETLSSDKIIKITAEEYAFQAPSEVTSGWNTFRMNNDGEETHLLFFTRLPEGKTFDNYMGEVAVQFVDLMDGLKAGEFSQEEAPGMMVRSIPQWFGDAVRMGGVGIMEAGGSSQVTMKLEPGNYFLECYMKTEEGDFHAMEGMARPLTVIPPNHPVTLHPRRM